jgi:hypothetical protein
MEQYDLKNPANRDEYIRFHQAVRKRLIRNPEWLNWNDMNNSNIQNLEKQYGITRNGRQFKPKPIIVSDKNRRMACVRCRELGQLCTGEAPQMCPQCAVAGLEAKDCVYESLNLKLPLWYSPVAVIQPAKPSLAGAGVAVPVGPAAAGGFSPIERNANSDNNNNTNNNANLDPSSPPEEKRKATAKRKARWNAVKAAIQQSKLTNNENQNNKHKKQKTNKQKQNHRRKQTRKQKQ